MKRRDKSIRYQIHAEQRMEQRGITRNQVALAVRSPDRIANAGRPGAQRCEKTIRNGRRLVVITEEDDTSIWVASAWWVG